ncbi:MAG: DUF6209 family protein [Chloroflexota bacterium]|nr:DUF6209 family protein [Chloroflexota bacterium]
MRAGEEGTPAGQTPDGEAERASTVAILRFRHSASGSGVAGTGHIRPGGLLRVEYDPARLPPTSDTHAPPEDIICHAQFFPGGERFSGSALLPSRGAARSDNRRQLPFEARVPAEATRLELWFESRGPSGTTGWDSRYGQNYSFVVSAEGLPVPEPSVAVRSDARVDPAVIHVVEDAATKEKTTIGSGGRRLHAGLVIRAQVADVSTALEVWADIHVFDAADELIHTGSVGLRQPDPTTPGAPFVWEDDVYEGSGGGSGIGVWSRPDAHTIQYRLYCQTGRPGSVAQGQLFTDGILHEFELPADEDVAGVGG